MGETFAFSLYRQASHIQFPSIFMPFLYPGPNSSTDAKHVVTSTFFVGDCLRPRTPPNGGGVAAYRLIPRSCPVTRPHIGPSTVAWWQIRPNRGGAVANPIQLHRRPRRFAGVRVDALAGRGMPPQTSPSPPLTMMSSRIYA